MRRVNRNDKKAQLEMWEELEAIQKAFPFTVQGLWLFASLVLEKTIAGSPHLTRTQKDILSFLLNGGKYIGIQASRGMTKQLLRLVRLGHYGNHAEWTSHKLPVRMTEAS
jgi:hypothetical protein